MAEATVIDERQYLDPVFLEYGMEIYDTEYIDRIREENINLKRLGKRVYNIVPQAGFQEKVITNEADIKIIGGKRGSGKSFISLFDATLYFEDPDANLYGFRRYENDVKRGIWKSAKQVFRGAANFADTSYEA